MLIHSRGLRCLLAVATAWGALACDDGEDNPQQGSASLAFTGLPAQLSCADDLDRSTDDLLEVDVTATVSGLRDPSGYSVRLLAGGATLAERDLTGDQIIFERAPLPLGALELSLELRAAGAIKAVARQTVTTAIDTSDPACSPPLPELRLSFEAPGADAVLTAADDLDGTLGNDVQIDVVVKIEGPGTGDVALAVGGTSAGRQPIVDGLARFPAVTLSAGDGGPQPQQLVATLGEARAERAVVVEVGACALSVTPVAVGAACVPDADPATEGTQIPLTATTNCTSVTFTVDGQETAPVPVVDNTARTTVTVPPGEFTLAASASTAGGITGQVEATTLTAAGPPARLGFNLNPVGVNRLDLSAATEDRWIIGGLARGVPADTAVQVTLDPPLPGVPAEALVDAEGRFALALAVTAAATCHQLTAHFTDPCTGPARSEAYSICLDGLVPQARIQRPVDGALITGNDDVAPGTPLLQLDVTLALEDAHDAAVDYDLGVACSSDNGATWTRRHDLPVRRSALSPEGEGVVRINLVPADEGLVRCRVLLDGAPNAPAAPPAVTWQLLYEAPTLSLLEPALVGERACVRDRLPVGGVGSNLDANEPALQAQLFDADGALAAEAPLGPTGNEGYRVEFGAPGGPALPEEGTYRLQITGTIQGNLPVTVVPAERAVIIDRTAPALALVDPPAGQPLGAADDADGDLSNCVQRALTFSVDDPTAAELCVSLNGGAARCAPVIDGRITTEPLDLVDGLNTLVGTALDCAGNPGRIEATLRTVGCAPRILIETPADGARISPAADLDPALAGIQLDATLATALAAGTLVEITVDGEPFGPAPVGADGRATIRVTLPTGPLPADPLTYTLRGRELAGGNTGPASRITLRSRPPEINLRPVADCLNRAAPDASPDPGFQLAVVADVLGADPGDLAQLVADCGAPSAPVAAAVAADGSLSFPPITLPDEARCRLSVELTDAAGLTGQGALDITVDRVAPTVTFISPAPGAFVTPADDEDRRDVPAAAGIQLTPRLEICGAAGETLTLTSNPPVEGGRLDAQVPEGDCAEVALRQLTFPQGQLSFTAVTRDACGNPAQAQNPVTVQAGGAISILDPRDRQSLRVAIDEDPATPGCQYTLLGTTFGLGADTEYTVCTDQPQGPPSARCDGDAEALAPGARCSIVGGNQLRCPISLTDDVHTLRVVGTFGERVFSQSVSVRSDCEAPRVASLQVLQAGADACVNRQERLNPNDANPVAAVTLRFTTEGIEDGQSAAILSEGGARVLGNLLVTNNQGEARINLPSGRHDIYLRSRDIAGNNLPADGEGGNRLTISVDVEPPAPALLNLAPDTCLNAAADTDGQTPGLQWGLQAQTGGTLEDPVRLDLGVGGLQRQSVGVITPQQRFDGLNLAEGPQSLTLTARDTCGNVGSVGGFVIVAGRPDWTQPSAVAFRVDTVAPNLRLEGLNPGATYGPAADADGDGANGFQLDVEARLLPADGIEPGGQIQIRSDGLPLLTAPSPLTIPAGFGGALPARITLAPGAQTLTATGADACGNPGQSPPIAINVDVGGCTSRLLDLAGTPTILGPADGDVVAGGLRRIVRGVVDLLDPTCAGATARLFAGDAALAEGPVGPGGAVEFTATLPEGAYSLSLRVQRGAEVTASAARGLAVDLTAPAVSFTSPVGDPAVVINDAEPDTDGFQALLVFEITEASRITARSARFEVNGVQVLGPLALPDTSPTPFSRALTLAPGLQEVTLCVRDAALNEACVSRQINVDVAPPGPVNASVEIRDPRSTEVALRFAAPGDDGLEGGPVQSYRIRRAAAPILDEAAWTSATALADRPGLAAPGAEETLILTELPLNAVHHVAVRAVDDAGRLGPLTSVAVDLSLGRAHYTVAPRGGAWSPDPLVNESGTIHALGDVDGDGYDDVLVTLAQAPNPGAQAAILFGRPDLEAAQPADIQPLTVPGTVWGPYFGAGGAAVGDLNGDGAPDLAVVGFEQATFTTIVVLYFGCPPGGECARDDVLTPRVSLRTGRVAYTVAGVGDFQRLPGEVGTFDDLVIGGSVAGGATAAYLVAGRPTAAWPAVLNVFELDPAAGQTSLVVPPGLPNAGQAGRAAAGVGDLDGDGFADLVLGDGGAFDYSFVYYGGAGLPAAYGLGDDPRNTQLAHPCRAAGTTLGRSIAGGVDLDGDPLGRPDLVVSDHIGKRVVVYDQDLQDLDCVALNEVQFGVDLDLAGDVNGDGHVDLLVSHRDDQGRPQDALVFYNDGAGRFGAGDQPRRPDVRLRNPDRLKQGVAGLGDVNGDGRADLGVLSFDIATGNLTVVIYY